MATQVILPKLGQTMEEGTIVEWLKEEGDVISRGDALFSLESDKAVLEVEARTKGTLLKILVGPGEKIPVGTPVAIIGQPNEDISDLAAGVVREEPLAESAQPAAQTGDDDDEAISVHDLIRREGGRSRPRRRRALWDPRDYDELDGDD